MPKKKISPYFTVGAFIFAAVFIFLLYFLNDYINPELRIAKELSIINYFQSFRAPFLDKAMLFFTTLGNWRIILGYGLIVAFALAFKKKWRHLTALLVSVLGGQLLVEVLKYTVGRARPVLQVLTTESSFSFPSGHAFVAISFYGMLTYFLYAAAKGKFWKSVSLIGGIALILLISLSRVYLGVHWPSDIIASFILGSAWLAMIISLLV